jgi:hypothetical protein
LLLAPAVIYYDRNKKTYFFTPGILSVPTPRGSRIQIGLALAAASAALLPTAAFAQAAFTAYVSPQYEYNSNVFDLPAGVAVLGTTDTRHADTDLVSRGGLISDYLISRQDFYANIDVAHFKYQHFSELDRDEYSVDAGWRWVLSRDLTGTLDVSRTKFMVPFSALLNQTGTLVLETVQKETASAQYQFNPDWRIDGSVFTRTEDAPVPDAPQLNLKDTSVSTTLTYTRNARLTGGANFVYDTGRYEEGVANLAPNYHEISLSGVANYAAKGLSSFSGLLGYTKRTSLTGTNDVSSVTGSFDYKRLLTGKTSMDLSISRSVNANITNTGSEVDTIVGGSLNWQATYKLNVALAYSWTNRYLPDQNGSSGAFVVVGGNRTDNTQYVGLNVDYQILRWLDIKPYCNYQMRSSNAQFGNYNATVVGVTVTAKYSRGVAATAR